MTGTGLEARTYEQRGGLRPGQKVTKAGLMRIAREQPHLLEKACLKALEDAAGETQVERAATFEGEAHKYRIEIEPVDRHRALALFRDTVDGKPEQAIDLDGAPTTQVVILNGVKGIDVVFPSETQALLQRELAAGARDPFDLDDPIPHAGEPEDSLDVQDE